MNRHTVYWIVAATITLGALGISASLHSGLPERIPTHWNIKGEVDGHGSRNTIFLMPGIMVGLIAMFAVIPLVSPKPFGVDSFRSTCLMIMVITMAMMAYLHGVILYATLHPDAPIGRLLVGGMMIFLAWIGNFMGKIRRNLYMGIRTPWTLASDRVWNDTHRLGAWLFMAGGILGALLCLVGLPVWSAFIPLSATIIIPIAYSYTRYKELEKRGELGESIDSLKPTGPAESA